MSCGAQIEFATMRCGEHGRTDMGRFKFLVLLFALSVGPLIPNVTANGAGPEWRVVSTQMNNQLAQRGRCKAFGETNKCKPTWDNRSKSCVCAGA
jgi:hypothetical protein